MPTLRAHLLQIKILENHQNGKDTHLRGLQVFARNDEDAGAVAAAAAAKRDGHPDAKAEAGTSRNKRKLHREDKYELGSGIGIGAVGRGGWDAYGGDVR